MEEIQELKQEIKEIDNRVSVVEQDMPVLKERYKNMDELFKQNICALDGLQKCMQDNKIAMEKMTMSLEMTNKTVDAFKEETGRNINELKTNVNILKEERNFNIMKFIKDNWVSIMALGGIAYYVITNFMK